MRKYLAIYEDSRLIWLCNRSLLNVLIFEENLLFFFISVDTPRVSLPGPLFLQILVFHSYRKNMNGGGRGSGRGRPWPRRRAAIYALQMKGRWESNINVWFPFMYSQKWNCYFQNRIIMFCLPVPTLIYLWEIYIFPGLACLFCRREICGLILGIYKWLTVTWMWKLRLRPRNSQKRNT